MKRNIFFKKTLIFTLIILFICDSFIPIIASKIDFQIIDDKNLSVVDTYENTSSLTFYTFDKSDRKQNTVELPSDIAIEIRNIYDELEYKIVNKPKSFETQELKNSFIDLIDEYGLLSEQQSRDEVFSLLNPDWLKYVNNSNSPKTQNSFSNSLINPFFNSHFGMSVFCSVSSGGAGMMMPLFMLPRPRAVGAWYSSDGVTSVANLFTGKGFLAGGSQGGFLLGFMGVGLTYAVPGATIYGFIGYSLFAGVTAELMAFFPPNNAPIIINENPLDGAVNVPLDLDKLSFRIEDADGDLMSYMLTTDPDIGFKSENLRPSGVYTVPIGGLKINSLYKWTVEVTDGKDSTKKQFLFYTPEAPFNPFDEGWQYRKKITIDHSHIAGNLSNFTMLVNTVDADLSAKAKADGDDILFMDGPGVANKLYHEIESYETSTGELIVWVNIMNLKADEDTVFYMYYGNLENINTQMSKRAWDPYFAGVWHLKDFLDSTINENHGNNYGSIAMSGKLGDARHFDGSNDYILVENDASLNFHTPNMFSVSFWLKRDRLNIYESVISKGTTAHKAGYAVQIKKNDSIMCIIYDGSNENTIFSNQKITDTNWHYITAVWDGSNISIFIDGILDASNNIGAITIKDDSKPLEFGHHYGYLDGYTPYAGGIDEIQISKINRNAVWISTSYLNQQNPLNFMIFGPEETP